METSGDEAGTLEGLGLSKNEAKAYLTLLRLGKANSAELARESGIHRINAYDVLNSLISKGMVSYVSEAGMRYFRPESPEKLMEFLSSKVASLEKALPGMLAEYGARKEACEVSVLRGAEGKRTQFEEIARMARNTENRVFTPHGLMSFERPPYDLMIRKWYERLAKQGVVSRHLTLDSPEARRRAVMLTGVKNYMIKFSKGIHFSPVSWNACGDLLFLTFHIEPYLIVRIRCRQIARAFIDGFELMWKSA